MQEDTPKTERKRPLRQRVAQRLTMKHGWFYDTPRNGVRTRIVALLRDNKPWWDWGHKLMIVVGRDFCGNWSEPESPTWWYRRDTPKRMWRTGYPRHPFRSFEIIKNYDEFHRRTEGLNEDGLYEWSAIGASQDGGLHLGHQYWGKNFYELPKDEWAILRRWMRVSRRIDWWGLRSWLYDQGLHAAVYRKKPLSCAAKPPRGQGGYDHWLCTLPRKHDGMHRYHNYVWGDIGGEAIGTMYDPQEVARG